MLVVVSDGRIKQTNNIQNKLDYIHQVNHIDSHQVEQSGMAGRWFISNEESVLNSKLGFCVSVCLNSSRGSITATGDRLFDFPERHRFDSTAKAASLVRSQRLSSLPPPLHPSSTSRPNNNSTYRFPSSHPNNSFLLSCPPHPHTLSVARNALRRPCPHVSTRTAPCTKQKNHSPRMHNIRLGPIPPPHKLLFPDPII